MMALFQEKIMNKCDRCRSVRPFITTFAVLVVLVANSAEASTRIELATSIKSILTGANSAVEWSVLIENASGSITYYSLNPDVPRRPASNTKLYTSAGAFGLLGPTYVWKGYELQSSSLSNPMEPLLSNSDNALADALYPVAGGGTKILPFFSSIGISMTGAQMYDGSGLNGSNRFTNRQTIQLLRYMMNKYTFNQWATHLSSACSKGTLVSRICGTETTKRIHGKTGTLSNTLALSGYLDNIHDNNRYFFSIMCNNTNSTIQSDTRNRIDAIAAALGKLNDPLATTGISSAAITMTGASQASITETPYGIAIKSAAAGPINVRIVDASGAVVARAAGTGEKGVEIPYARIKTGVHFIIVTTEHGTSQHRFFQLAQ